MLAAPAIAVGVTSSQNGAVAAGCLDTDNQQRVTKAAGTHYSPWLKTGSRCADINYQLGWGDQARKVKVCFKYAGCQSSYKVAENLKWKVIASNVKDGTEYRLYFASSSPAIGGTVAD